MTFQSSAYLIRCADSAHVFTQRQRITVDVISENAQSGEAGRQTQESQHGPVDPQCSLSSFNVPDGQQSLDLDNKGKQGHVGHWNYNQIGQWILESDWKRRAGRS